MVAVPSAAVQAQLWPLLAENARANKTAHAAPQHGQLRVGQKYQQSNQWAIETLAAAMEPTTIRTREQAQAWLRFRAMSPPPCGWGR